MTSISQAYIDRSQVVLMIRGMNTQMAHVKVKTFSWLMVRRTAPVRLDILI